MSRCCTARWCSHGFYAAALHGDMDQRARTAALDEFRNGEIALLVASDVAARGLDIPAVSHVFNFDVPHHPEDYVHRIGRTGRAGRTGAAFTLVAPEDTRSLGAIEALIGQPVPWLDGDLTTVAESSGDTATRHRGRSGESRRGARSTKAGPPGPPRAPERPRLPANVRRPGAAALDRPRRVPRAARRAVPRRAPSGAPTTRAASRGGEAGREERGRRIESDGDTPVGLGAHVPAFLLRPSWRRRRITEVYRALLVPTRRSYRRQGRAHARRSDRTSRDSDDRGDVSGPRPASPWRNAATI